jgi:hypothetical protein
MISSSKTQEPSLRPDGNVEEDPTEMVEPLRKTHAD